MTRNVKVLVFILVATVANILMTALIFIALLGIYGLTLGRVLQISLAAPVILIAFIASVVLAGFIYNRVLKKVSVKYGLENMLGMKKK